jgi:hypothetical protein
LTPTRNFRPSLQNRNTAGASYARSAPLHTVDFL